MTRCSRKIRAAVAVFLCVTLTFSFPVTSLAYANDNAATSERTRGTANEATNATTSDPTNTPTDTTTTEPTSSSAAPTDQSFAAADNGEAFENPVIISENNVKDTPTTTLDDIAAALNSMSVANSTTNEPDAQSSGTYGALALSAAATSTTSQTPTVELYGTTSYDTAAEEALYTFESSEYAIIANGDTAIDALSASSLAGVLNCPILLANNEELPSVSADALKQLGVKKAILVGETAVLPNSVKEAVEHVTTESALRLGGTTAIDTQLEIFRYGQENEYWGSDCLIAQGEVSFADALSLGPVAYVLHAPIFLVGKDTKLSQKSLTALKEGSFTRAIVGGGTAVIAESTLTDIRAQLADVEQDGQTGQTESTGQAEQTQNTSSAAVIRLAGYSLYDTSAEVASWSVEQGILNWNRAAFATGMTMTDSLAGSVVQGRDSSVVLLIDENNYATLDAISPYKNDIDSIKFFGGPAVVYPTTRNDITDELGLPRSTVGKTAATEKEKLSLGLYEFAEMEVGYKVNSDGSEASQEDILEYMDPTNFDNTTSEYMQFVNIGAGYSGISAETLDAFIDAGATAAEKRYNSGSWSDYYGFTITSNLRGMGQAIVEAAQKYNVNEAYLLAHAIIESDWGCSALSQGYRWDKENSEWISYGYLNFFGIGAFDSDPENGGSYAGYYGWSSPDAALRGGAAWISKYYIHSGDEDSGDQNTLWKMAWDANAAEKYGNMSHAHQYATGRTWAIGIAWTMDNIYTKHMGGTFDFVDLGVKALVPVFEG